MSFYFLSSFSYWREFHLFTRLRKELEMHKEGELELLREALSSEIRFLKSVRCTLCCERGFLFRLIKTVLYSCSSPTRNIFQIQLWCSTSWFNFFKMLPWKRKFKSHSFILILQGVLCRRSFIFLLFSISRSWTAARGVSRHNDDTGTQVILVHWLSLC